MQEEGVISGWGLGVNTTEPIELAMELEETPPSVCLTATQYTLLQHERALERMMPLAEQKGLRLIVGSPFDSGALLGGDHFHYAEVPPAIRQRVQQLRETAEQYAVSLKDAAIQFSAAHPAVSMVIPGSSRPEHLREDAESMSAQIPAEFWEQLRDRGLISERAPVPDQE